MAFCSNCGEKMNEGAKFCSNCGTPVGATPDLTNDTKQVEEKVTKVAGSFLSGLKTVTESAKQVIVENTAKGNNQPVMASPIIPPTEINTDRASRKQEYAGVILKCPHCGTPITQSTAVCPECGNYVTGQAAANSIQTFNEQLMAIESRRKKAGLGTVFGLTVDPIDNQKLALIRSFPVPNSVDDILEFMLLAVANIDVGLSKNTLMNRFEKSSKTSETSASIPKTLSDAWVSKMQQMYHKAALSFPNDPLFPQIKKIYEDKMKELKMPID